MTIAACPEDSHSDDFVKYLGSAAIYFFEDGNLYIDLMADGGTVAFALAKTIANDDGEGALSQPTSPEGNTNDRGPNAHANGTYQAPYYIIASGDTLSSIGQRFGVAWQDIALANGVQDSLIYAGQTLLIPDGSTPITPVPEQGEAERVSFQSGAISDSRSGIINQGVPKSYALSISKGQTITVDTASHDEPLGISIGNTLGDLLPVEGTNSQINNSVSIVLSESRDFIVTVRPLTIPENPQMTFDITFTIR
jgi:LysM repeat protein